MGLPSDANPAVPKSVSGASDAGDGGGDFLITLGLWDNNTGTEFVQKSTFVHEFGHTAGLRHGGEQSTATVPAVNCKPSYLSVMNYLFQVRGLIGATGPVIDYSRQDLQLRTGLSGNGKGDLDEANLTETELRVEDGTDGALYPTRWYAPLNTSLIDNPNVANTSPSTRHCDGSPLRPDELVNGVNGNPETPMVRIDGTYPVGRIDWNAGGTLDTANPSLPTYPQDINYNGDGPGSDPSVLSPAADGTFKGWNDWFNLDLRQVGARRVPGILSLEISTDDLGPIDPIVGDWGYGDWGYGDWGYGDWGYGDWGYGDWGYGDWGYGDWGYGDDIDELTAKSQGPAPNSFKVVSRTSQAVTLQWTPPTAGGALAGYEVWKSTGLISSSNLPAALANVPVCTPTCTYVDNTIANNGTYQYFVVAAFQSSQRTRTEVITSVRR